MKKFKLFIENIFVYGVGGVISKIIPLIMVPIITRLMPNSGYYGLSDLCSTITSFGASIAILGMYDAMYRLFFEKEDLEYKKRVCSTAILFTLTFSLFISLIIFLLKDVLAVFVFGTIDYSYLVVIAAIATASTATNNLVSAPTRMQNQKIKYILINTLSPIVAYSVTIPLILNGYYIIAVPIGSLIAGFTIEIIYLFLNHKWFDFRLFDFSILKDLLKIGIPLFPTFLIYWVFNSSDKLMISNLLNVSQVGIYSAGSKLGHCSQIIYVAFTGGWQYFSFSTMKDENQVETNSRIFEYLGVISFITTMFVCALCKPIYGFLFTEEYAPGFVVAPYLFLAPLLQMLFQVSCNQFLIIKKSGYIPFTLFLGAVLNIIANYILIPILGIEGAAVATLLGYGVSTVICVLILTHIHMMAVRKRFLCICGCMALYIVIWRFVTIDSALISTIVAMLFCIVFSLFYKSDIALFKNMLIKKELAK